MPPRINELVGGAILALLIGGLFGLILIEWAVGCGESYVDAHGERHYYDCVVLDAVKRK